MGLKTLKKENDFLNMTLMEIISSIDSSKTKKYTQFLVKMIKKDIEDLETDFCQFGYDDEVIKVINKFNNNENKMKSWLGFKILKSFFSLKQINCFISFCEFSDKKMILDNDISKYKCWDKLITENYFAINKEEIKRAKKEIKVIYEDDDYLIIKPLSHMASVKYGYNTRWCTSSINECDYFYNYSKEGILIYVINKITNEKFGFFRKGFENSGLEIYNSEDERIDSYQTNIPKNILDILFKETNPKLNENNFNLFSEYEKKKVLQNNLIHELPTPIIPINRNFSNYESMIDSLSDELP